MPSASDSSNSVHNPWLHRYAILTACCCFFLLFMGGLVTSHSAGLSVPDWPSSYGYNMYTFPMKDWVGNIFYEHTHRLFASFVGFLILTQAILFQWKEPRKWVKRLAWLALGGVIAQGVLGGLTVLFYLPPAISSAHAGLGQSMFCLTIIIAMVTNKRWDDQIVKKAEWARPGIRTLSAVAVGVIFIQLMLGAVMRHTSSGLAIPTFPLAFGKIIPDFTSFGIAINFAHRAWAVVVTFTIFWTASTIFRKYAGQKKLLIPALLVMFLLGVQIMLGAITILSHKAVTPTTLHVICGAAILGTMVYIATMSRHLYRGVLVGSNGQPLSKSSIPAYQSSSAPLISEA